ncbi:ribosome biogenesis GTPase Der [Neoehrlichia mikurensis]|uniref:GTPase Der n=1 Tax=Neoehrlichia mikurensis TaxID=89586 RepID=A0A9Q9C0P4_9RICK|nr:ribosome biogenesis GTPase Der [Neoehrlichia mikurensis]QXK91869.1 ribosome biogenesis GTPase Der [Neoehrlichia mikurensis]QXK93082.1 ribosome biogenesis GTPase Der [Neoehrlichia mikurensis]QXK93562.1 ribosome biogenesis GTPase Der [Neoehrlichia mikurensis]UTO55484.1 ribosome biogenesis GTPase Der [Neoehrlichia mikurensis]UTO56405.1 ribosome biogenesis GTPase Der [Neoehrlichia mikurensis]
MLEVAIIGLPNAGKSTLFNRLIGKRLAIVSDIPNVTRDRRESYVNLCGLKFKIIDTGGIDNSVKLSYLIIEQVKLAIKSANVIFFVVDAKENCNNKVTNLAKWLRKLTNKPIILIANKCESDKKCYPVDYLEYFNFIGPVYISAEHNLGMADLYDALTSVCKESDFEKERVQAIKVSIVGQPNVGKSTLINTLLNDNRLITDSEAGTTRDAIDVTYYYKGKKFILVDTAGMRKKSKVVESIETFSNRSSISSIVKSDIIILIVDFILGISQQDLAIAEIAIQKGKPLIIALNKLDLIDVPIEKEKLRDIIQQNNKIDFKVPIIEISALKNVNCNKVLDKCLEIYDVINKRVSTSELNRWLSLTVSHHSPPLHNGKKVKLKYITQISVMPLVFIILTNVEEVDATYQKYLKNSLTKSFFYEVPIKIFLKKNHNPYINNK